MMMMLTLLMLPCFIGYSRCQLATSLTTAPTTSRPQNFNSSRAHPPVPRLQVPAVVAHNFFQDLPDDFRSASLAEHWPSSPAAFERPLSKVDLMALKVDHSLMASLDRWLSKYGIEIPQSVLRTIDEMDLCPQRASDGMTRKSTYYTCMLSILMGVDVGVRRDRVLSRIQLQGV